MKAWLWVLLCALGIYSTIPLARSFQKLVYKSVGKEFFTYLVFFIIATGLITLLYYFICKLKIKNASQYIYLIFCAGLYIYLTIQLSGSPEEAIHFIEYGLLSFLVFRALSYRIKDWTIYITAAFLVMLFGTLDEFLQWMMPSRYWDYRDVGINFIGGAILLLAIFKGVKPSDISGPARGYSVRILVGAITLNLIFIGLCLSNTPDNVNRYTSSIGFLSWLQQEESMTEYGHNHYDPEIGHFNSRFELEELINIDRTLGRSYGFSLNNELKSNLQEEELLGKYSPGTNSFLNEFLQHYYRRRNGFNKFNNADIPINNSYSANKAFAENLLLNKYFSKTLKQSGLTWSSDRENIVRNTASEWQKNYVSNTGKFITAFSQETARMVLLLALFALWIGGEIWKRKLSDG